MSNKSGIAEQVLPLPKGGGAVAGIGETFSPDLHTGTGNFTVPLTVPAGRNGFQPQLSLGYSSGSPNGPFGLGWSLSIPGISRKTQKGLPTYNDASDTFVLSGAEDLVPVPGAPAGITRYRPRTEGLFARIDHVRGGAGDYWEVRSKDGLVSRYGTARPSDATHDWLDPAAVIDQAERSHIFAWKLAQTTDTFGNRIEYIYERDSQRTGGPHVWDQVYLSEIKYADYGDLPSQQFLLSIKFVYGDRPDPFSDNRPGFELRTVRRCTRIESWLHDGAPSLTRTYDLVYLDQITPRKQRLPVNGVSLLTQVHVGGHDQTTPNLLTNPAFAGVGPLGPATTYTYTGSPGEAHGSYSSADAWTTWCNPAATIATEILPSTCPTAPDGFAGKMIHVTTTASGCGLVHVFGAVDTGPSNAVAAAWVYVARGRLGIGTGNGGNVSTDAVSKSTGRWEYVEATNGVNPANEFTIYANSDDGADYYVAYASVSTAAREEWLPPIEFGYTSFEPEQRKYASLSAVGNALPAQSLADKAYELVDLFGNGLPSVLHMNGAVRYWRNLGAGRLDVPRSMATAPPVELGDPGVQIADMNGDGRADLLVTSVPLSGYFPLSAAGTWDVRGYIPYATAPSFSLQDPEVRLVDLNGDGVVDVLRTSSRFELFYNDPRSGWTTSPPRERGPSTTFPDVNFSDPRVRLGDMTGDGLQDIVMVTNGRVDYWPYQGYGRWGKRMTMANSPRFEDAAIYGSAGYDPRRVLIGDIDGDGCADLAYVGSGHTTIWINQSGNSFSDPIVIRGTPPMNDQDAVRLADMYGSGTAGILWTYDASTYAENTYKFLDLTGGIKPYLLNQMNNHRGAVTQVDYVPSTRFYLEDQQRPETRWQTTLPFPVQVVSRVQVIDAFSGGKLTTEYSYHHGAWDGAEREFRGFGRVDHRDTEVFSDYNDGQSGSTAFASVPAESFSPPTETRTWFYQGPLGPEFGDWNVPDFVGEYWSGDSPVLSPSSEQTHFLQMLQQRWRQAYRDALRSMRGRVIRTEMYSLDGGPLQNRPYTVTESLHEVLGLPVGTTWPDTPDSWQLRVFLPTTVAERTTRWERGSDPLWQYTFTERGDLDRYGQPRSKISVACPRGFTPHAAPGAPYLVTRAATDYAQRDDIAYIVDRIASVTTYEVRADGTQTVPDLHIAIQNGSASQAIISQALSFYDGPAFQGQPYGQIDTHGALVRTENLVITRELLDQAYASGSTVTNPPEEPPYLAQGGPPHWTDEYPHEFQNRLQVDAGYVYQTANDGSPHITGYYASSERRRYDFQTDPAGAGRGLVQVRRDALGNDTATGYDNYQLLPSLVTDPLKLLRTASYDYRVLQPDAVTDPNGNQTIMSYTPLGLLATRWIRGKTSAEGDRSRASTVFAYELQAFDNMGQPLSVETTRYVHHDTELDIPEPQRDETILSVEYSDGFGRLLQTRTQADDVVVGEPVFGDVGLPSDQSQAVGNAVGASVVAGTMRVVVSGWQTYDNKGRVVEKYEPFFSTGWNYLARDEATPELFGAKTTLVHDGPGRLVRTINPDKSEERVVRGVPGTIAKPDMRNPDVFEPTPWETYTYDPNDNAGRTDPEQSQSYSNHWDTPSSALIDALGRTVSVVQRNGNDPATDWYTTHSEYDIRGNLLQVVDTLGRIACRQMYDLDNKELRREQLDSGVCRIILDAGGNEIERRDGKGGLILRVFDAASRPLRTWARDAAGERQSMRERYVYGDEVDAAAAVPANQLGRLYRIYDEAGLVEFGTYDFKGNIVETKRQLISDVQILQVFDNGPKNSWRIHPYRVEWNPGTTSLDTYAASLLDSTIYETSMRYDALNRAKMLTYPTDVNGNRFQLQPSYSRAGALERLVDAAGTVWVDRIAYNAKGQRTLTTCGNGIMTRFAYDRATFRLTRLRSEAYTTPAPLTYHPSGAPLQDFGYEYDLSGNVLAVHDRTPGSGVAATPDSLDRAFVYDPIYRLLSATGRECDIPAAPPPWLDAPRCTDLTRTRSYTETYLYDTVGNLAHLTHVPDGGSGFTRSLILASGRNQLASLTTANTPYAYAYDPAGNLSREASERYFEWDHSNRMRVFRIQPADTEPSLYVQYLYDTEGQRAKKVVRKQGGSFEATAYIGGVYEFHQSTQGATTVKNTVCHVLDDKDRVALLRIGDPLPGDRAPALQHLLSDSLGSTNVVLDGTGSWINREEYTPYGETTFGSFARKRYRFTGKERDEESGLGYHSARYYAPWLCRWTACDPAGLVDGLNPYTYVGGNPMRLTDASGLAGSDTLQICIYDSHTGELLGGLPSCYGTPGSETGSGGGASAEPSAESRAGSDAGTIDQAGAGTTADLSTNSSGTLGDEFVQGTAGLVYGTVQAFTPGGFLAPSPLPSSRPFEYFRAAGLAATGIAQLVSGLAMLTGGGGAAIAGVAAAPVSGGASLLLTGAGAGVVVAGVAAVAQGLVNVAAGVTSAVLAMSAAGTGGNGSGVEPPAISAASMPTEGAEDLEEHHLFPQNKDFKAKFAKMGVDVDRFTAKIPKSMHRLKSGAGLHTTAGGNWNARWAQFFKDHPNPSPADAPAAWNLLDEMTKGVWR